MFPLCYLGCFHVVARMIISYGGFIHATLVIAYEEAGEVYRTLAKGIAIGGMLLLAVSCQSDETATPTAVAEPVSKLSPDLTITLGDIDSTDPAKKIARLQPLADYLAEHLSDQSITRGRVVIARDTAEMAKLLSDGTVDVYLDSAFPTLTVQEMSGSQIVARRWKDASPTYWSTYIALRSSGIDSVEDFVGKVVAFEEPYSTSGFILPAGTLIQNGFDLAEVGAPDASVEHNKINYYFAYDEENTIELLLNGDVAGGGISNQDYDVLPEELKEQIIAFGSTLEVPRQLVSVGPGLDPQLVSMIQQLLYGLDETEEGLQILEGIKKTTKFDEMPSDSEAALVGLKSLIKLVSQG